MVFPLNHKSFTTIPLSSTPLFCFFLLCTFPLRFLPTGLTLEHTLQLPDSVYFNDFSMQLDLRFFLRLPSVSFTTYWVASRIKLTIKHFASAKPIHPSSAVPLMADYLKQKNEQPSQRHRRRVTSVKLIFFSRQQDIGIVRTFVRHNGSQLPSSSHHSEKNQHKFKTKGDQFLKGLFQRVRQSMLKRLH